MGLPRSAEIAIYIIVILLTLCVAAICSGLNIGLLSIDPLKLEILEKRGEPNERKAAKKVKRLMDDRHLLLCSILLFNALCMEVLPILLDELVGENLAILISVTALVVFGEIVPQAVCNKYGLQIGAAVAPILWLMIITTFAATYPLARFLDWLLGAQKIRLYNRMELAEIVEMHQESASSDHGGAEQTETSDSSDSALDEEEVKQITGVIKASSMLVSHKDVLTPLEDVVMLSVDAVFGMETLDFLAKCGRSRIPIYEGNRENVIGVIHVKQLILYKPSMQEKLDKNSLRQNLLFLDKNTKIFHALDQFQTGKSHLAIVRDEEKVYGIVTLEDILEIILQSEIFDEDDITHIETVQTDQQQDNKPILMKNFI